VPVLDGCKIVALDAEGAILEAPGGLLHDQVRLDDEMPA